VTASGLPPAGASYAAASFVDCRRAEVAQVGHTEDSACEPSR
jgi:hypothetical protein